MNYSRTGEGTPFDPFIIIRSSSRDKIPHLYQIQVGLADNKMLKSGTRSRQDIYYHNITSTIFWHAVSKKTLVEACQINSITNQILYYNK